MTLARGKLPWKLSFFAILWVLWKERNMRRYEGKGSSVDVLVDNFLWLLALLHLYFKASLWR